MRDFLKMGVTGRKKRNLQARERNQAKNWRLRRLGRRYQVDAKKAKAPRRNGQKRAGNAENYRLCCQHGVETTRIRKWPNFFSSDFNRDGLSLSTVSVHSGGLFTFSSGGAVTGVQKRTCVRQGMFYFLTNQSFSIPDIDKNRC